jgi:aromatic ring-opening dioxygenase catalytic subunit (LigB family)
MSAPARQPAIFVSHGGGPCFWMDMPPPIGPHGFDNLRDYLAGILPSLPERPKAILVISGHWEEPVTTVSTNPAPSMYFDYYGFPEETYRLSYPAPGAPELAERVRGLVANAGIDVATDSTRGFDHGVFVPFLIIDPEARIPVVMLSLRRDLDAAFHVALGKALAPLRDEGILIVGSGNSFHNLRTFFNGETGASEAFDTWLTAAVTDASADRRNDALAHWDEAPRARECQPREDHLIPLMVVAGAAGSDVGRRAFHDKIGGKWISGYAFG